MSLKKSIFQKKSAFSNAKADDKGVRKLCDNPVQTIQNHGNKYKGQRFCLDIHGQHKEDFEKLKAFFGDTHEVKGAAIAREFGRNKIHPHWQVYFELTEPKRMKERMTEILGHSEFHLEVARGTQAANLNYVYGVDKDYEVGFVDYNKNLPIPRRYRPKAAQFWNNIVLKPFQKEILEMATSETDSRSIHYFYESKGNTGKTIIAEYLHIFHGAIITGGSASDMKHAISRWKEITGSSPVIIIVNLARSDDFTYAACKALESIKDGLFFDGKYESGMVHSPEKPHVFIFANRRPETSAFSKDRWKIFRIVDEKLVPLKKF